MFRLSRAWLGWLVLALSLPAAGATPQEFVRLEVKLTEKPSQTGARSQTVFCDTLELLMGCRTEALCGNLSLELEYTGMQDSLVGIELTQITLPPLNRANAFKLRSPLGVPLIVDSVLLKHDAVYRAFYTPVKIGRAQLSCAYDHTDPDAFYSDPSAHFEIFFVQKSLGDYHWNNIRDFYEREYRAFDQIFHIVDPGKLNVYLYPCSTFTYARFKNSDFGLNPAKNHLFQEYSHFTTTIPASAANLTRLYRYWGYAPRALAEGAANLTDFYAFYCRYYKVSEGLYPLRKLLVTADYDRLPDGHKKAMEAASFVRYLMDKHGPDRFRDLYVDATDLGLSEDLMKLSGLNLDQLETDWLRYVDTIQFNPGWYHYFAQRELAQGHMAQATFIYEEGLKQVPNDTTAIIELSNVYFMSGQYRKSAALTARMNQLTSSNRYDLPLANMLLFAGAADSARTFYHAAEQRDSGEAMIALKLGQLEYLTGDADSARKLLEHGLGATESIPLKIDFQLCLGLIAGRQGRAPAADSSFTYALNAAKVLIDEHQDNPTYILRAGEAACYLRQTQAAKDYLELAEFLEFRPFYLGRALVALGKNADLSGDRTAARQYYRQALKLPVAYFEKLEAQRYLTAPFTL